jgi:hypothetical protein
VGVMRVVPFTGAVFRVRWAKVICDGVSGEIVSRLNTPMKRNERDLLMRVYQPPQSCRRPFVSSTGPRNIPPSRTGTVSTALVTANRVANKKATRTMVSSGLSFSFLFVGGDDKRDRLFSFSSSS